MNDLFEKFKTRLLNTYSEIISLSSSIEKNVPVTTSKEGKLQWGQNIMKLQSLNISFFELASIIKDDLGKPLSEVSKEVDEYDKLYSLLKSPTQTTDSEEVKKIKEYIQTINN